ncbi:thiamine-phosphate kinase [Novosphingobium sp.]|uniref:thiamine-phosphate kinase n=1 Tax=Novosphingobium sp. TaxID=1874826 RepID=UPI0025DCE348|nr:thiamine-phosphate kinase [Novosphingobium sp.]MCC6925992.1 thiamine-phosphate kinase [Novosphingobium sp.]
MIEHAFINALQALATHPSARGLQDDCAVLDLGGETLVLTHDAMAEGLHFLPGQDPADVAWKLVATNLSDLAAKGAEPLGVLLGYQLAQDDLRFLEGLREVLEHYQVPLLGGDTIGRSGPQVLGLTALGRATHRPVPSRSGARAGDRVWITGPVGGAMLALEALKAGSGDSLAYRRPQALLREGQALAPVVSAMMDISDGLLLDASRLAVASGVTLALDSLAVPIAAPEARRDAALRWGEDYQLLFTASAEAVIPVPAEPIGTVLTDGGEPLLLDGVPPAGHLGYEHG